MALSKLTQNFRYGVLSIFSDASRFLREAIKFIYVTIIAKSAIQSNPDVADEYWPYAMQIVKKNLESNLQKPVSFGSFLKREQSDLVRRWSALKIDLPI